MRPQHHFTAPRGWINDPYGVVHHDGRYHLFFQYVPEHTTWQFGVHWGHATSDDLVHWEYEGIALTPDGDEGCWSGTIVQVAGEAATMLYTSVFPADPAAGAVGVAHPVDDEWSAWRKGAVLIDVPEGVSVTAFRDPFVFRDDAGWHLLMGAGFTDDTAAILVFDSADLITWSYGGIFASRHLTDVEPMPMGSIWECPQLIEVDGRWVLVFSAMEPYHQLFEAYAIGDLVDGRFTPEHWGRLTYGPGYYAGSAFADADGQPCMVHWIREVNDPEGQWSGALSITHRLRIVDDVLTLEPHPGAEQAGVDVVALRSWARQTVFAIGANGRAVPVGIEIVNEPGVITVIAGGERWQLPSSSGEVTMVLDSLVCELFTDRGALAFAVPVDAPAAQTATPA